MTLIRKMAGAASLFAVAALMVASFAASTASAQPASPMTLFGLTGQGEVVEGDTIEAWIDGAVVGTAVADAEGWSITVDDAAAGAEVSFSINGELAAETVNYEAFGFAEVSLTVGDAAPAPEAPAPAETGNAGMLGSTGTSMALVLALGVFAAALVAGGRTATRRS